MSAFVHFMLKEEKNNKKNNGGQSYWDSLWIPGAVGYDTSSYFYRHSKKKKDLP